MKLEELMVDSKAAWVDYPGSPGLEIEIVNLSRKELLGLRKKCIVQKFDRKNRIMGEDLDEDKFIHEFTKATVSNWKGFILKFLEVLLLVDLKEEDPEKELEFTLHLSFPFPSHLPNSLNQSIVPLISNS